ncbi:MAG: hypothetical protein NW218_17645 [Saprospiraceae bacterium]|nr:hypothetical protein [Saprospiraceae bacterium]
MKKYVAILLLALLTNLCAAQEKDCLLPGNADFLKGIWIGTFTQYACNVNETYPMTIEIDRVEGKKISGMFIWKSVPNALDSKTKLEGEIMGSKIFLYEKELISGGDIVLDGVYEISVYDCEALNGNWKINKLQNNCNDPKALTDGGRFTIRKLSPPKQTAPTNKKRAVKIVNNLEVTTKYITISLWDDKEEDGDIIDLRINGEIAIKDFIVKKKPIEVIIPLLEAENILELYAVNLGSIPPNTASLSISSGGNVVSTITLKSDMNKSEAIKITKK